MNRYKICLLGILLSFSEIMFSQETPQIRLNTILDTIPFELTEHNNISITAIINKVDTVDLMLHTAASDVSLIRKVSETLTSIEWNQADKVKSWGGEHEARFSKRNSIQIGEFQWDSISIWENENSGPTTDGKFGPDLFQDKVIEIDFDQSILIIHKVPPNEIIAYQKLPLIFESDFMFIEGTSTINGQDYTNRFLIHSGYGGTILYDDKFVAESKIVGHVEIIEEQELKDSYGNVLKVKKGKLPKFTIGEKVFEDLPVGFFEGVIGKQRMSVMGGDLLKRFNMIIDSERNFLYLKSNQLTSLPYTDISKKKSKADKKS